MTVEYLSTEAPPRHRHPWLTGAVIVLLLAVVGGLLLWSGHLKTEANTTFAAAAVEAQDRARIGEARVLSTLQYATPLIWSEEVSEDVRAGLRALVQKSAADAAATLTELANEVSATRVLPWQSLQVEARDRVLDLIIDERTRFDRIAIDARDIGSVLAEDEPSDVAVRDALRASGADV